MAVREFHGIIRNLCDNPLLRTADAVDDGQWQDPWYPSKIPGAGRIETSHEGEWRSESDGIATGTSGWARWAVRVVNPFESPTEHFEWVQVNWALPFLGKPDLTFGTTRKDPEPSDAFATTDTRPPSLEIVLTKVNNIDIPRDTALQTTLYFAALPLSFLVHLIPSLSEIDAEFVVQPRVGAQSSALTFPTGLPTREQMGMEAFHNRMQSAAALGFLGGFPNFYETATGRDHFGGTILVRSAAGEFQDVPLSALGNISLSSFTDRIRAVNTWATAQISRDANSIAADGSPVLVHPFVGAFPTFFHANYGQGVVCGTILVNSDGAERRDIPQSQLGGVIGDNFEARFRAVQDYATKNGFVGGLPTFIDGEGLTNAGAGRMHSEMLYGTVLFKFDHSRLVLNPTNAASHTETFAAKRDLLLFRDPA